MNLFLNGGSIGGLMRPFFFRRINPLNIVRNTLRQNIYCKLNKLPLKLHIRVCFKSRSSSGWDRSEIHSRLLWSQLRGAGRSLLKTNPRSVSPQQILGFCYFWPRWKRDQRPWESKVGSVALWKDLHNLWVWKWLDCIDDLSRNKNRSKQPFSSYDYLQKGKVSLF